MKRVELIKTVAGLGCVLIRHGAKHDWYRNPTTGVSQPVPRHREIAENLARHIIRMLRDDSDQSDS
jgi:predicted RNA binding protein YcfA (HicA-like mRNA interferase family)